MIKTRQEPEAIRPPAPPRAPSRRRRTLSLALALVLSGLSIWAAGRFHRPPPPPPALPPGLRVGSGNRISLSSNAPQWKVLKTGEARPAQATWSDWVPARVRIDEAHASKVGTPLLGRVSTVLVELGEAVQAGQPLFSVASPEIAGLRAEKEKAEVDQDAANAVLDRVRAMVAEHALPGKEEVTALQQFRQSEVALKLAVAKLEALKVSSQAQNEFTVAAPRDGVVVEKNLLPAQEVSPDTGPLMVIADLSTVWVVADIFEADVGPVHEGLAARVTSPSFPDVVIDARVDMVSAVVDPVRHTVPVRVRLPNVDRRLRPNLYTQVRFAVEPRDGSVEVPASALVSDGRRQYVYVEEGPGDFNRREVVAASAHSGRVAILSGLRSGEVVVEEGAILLDNQIALVH